MARPRTHRALLPVAAFLLATCNSHPLTPITVETVVEQRDERPQITEVTPVDILFVVDNSGSMEEEQNNVAANFSRFIDRITGLNADFRIALITTDMVSPRASGRFWSCSNDASLCPGRTNPKVLTSQTPNLAQTFNENVRSLGTGGDGFEKGLAAIRAALSEPLLSTDNANFLRSNALLAVIIVSDEEDCSHPGNLIEDDGDRCVREIDKMIPVSQYVDFLKGLKGGDASKIFVGVITGPDIPRSMTRCNCNRDSDCRSGGSCTSSDNHSGNCNSLYGQCVPVNPSFTACQTDSDCGAGMRCLGLKCLPEVSETRRGRDCTPPAGLSSCTYRPREYSCFAPGTGLAEPGTRYLELARAFGANSVYASICASDWSESMDAIGSRVAQLIKRFPLSSFKVNPNRLPASARDIVVKVNGNEQPTGWVYNCPEGTGEFRFGSVSFDPGASPGVGATVQIIYEPARTPPTPCGSRAGAMSCPAPQVCGNCDFCEVRP